MVKGIVINNRDCAKIKIDDQQLLDIGICSFITYRYNTQTIEHGYSYIEIRKPNKEPEYQKCVAHKIDPNTVTESWQWHICDGKEKDFLEWYSLIPQKLDNWGFEWSEIQHTYEEIKNDSTK